MRNQSRNRGSILGYAGAAAVSVVITFAILAASGWLRPAAASHAGTSASAHSLPQWMMAAGLLGAPAMTPGPAAPSGNAYTGVADYPTPGSYSFTVPEGVSTVLVQLYGAGGGGGGASGSNQGGGGGGTGAYAMSVVTVTPGETYTVNVGAAGTGSSYGHRGVDGGVTSFVDASGNVLVGAGGGGGGADTGQGGPGGLLTGNPQIGRAGIFGALGGRSIGGSNTLGYTLSTIQNVIPTGTDYPANEVGGGGGGGARNPGGPGQNGYAFIAW